MITLNEYIDGALDCTYAENGRGPVAFDCWGLVMDVFARVRGVFLPDALDGPTEGRAAWTDHLVQRYAERVELDALAQFDIVFMTLDQAEGDINHAAIYLGHGRIFHIGSRIGVRVEPLDPYQRARKVLGAVRYAG